MAGPNFPLHTATSYTNVDSTKVQQDPKANNCSVWGLAKKAGMEKPLRAVLKMLQVFPKRYANMYHHASISSDGNLYRLCNNWLHKF